MARRPNPVRPRVKDARSYNAMLRRLYLGPLQRRMQKALGQAEAANQAWRSMDDVIGQMQAQLHAGVPRYQVQRALDRMNGYHRERLKKTFSAALGVDISRFLAEPEIRAYMAQVLQENVDLIKTIGTRYHAGLRTRLAQSLEAAPFDQAMVRDVLRQEYKSSGYNLRRLTRDQTSKTIGRLTELRHGQLGIEKYEWADSRDNAVRPVCRENNGKIFAWGKPPEGGHPGAKIQCRCVGIPVIDGASKQRLKGRQSAHQDVPVAPPPPPKPADPFTASGVQRTAEEMDWHQSSWNAASPEMREALARVPALRGVTRRSKKNAWYDWGAIEMDQILRSSPGGQATWRHEFGRHVDTLAGRRLGIRGGKGNHWQASASPEFKAAANGDIKKLSAKYYKPRDLETSLFHVRERAKEGARLRRGPVRERRAAMRQALNDAGLKLEDATAFLSEHGPLRLAALNQAEREVIIWRFARAWADRDAQGLIDLFCRGGLGRGRALQRITGGNSVITSEFGYLPSSQVARYADEALIRPNSMMAIKIANRKRAIGGTGPKLSDAFNALSRGRIDAGWNHADSYYARNGADWRYLEALADILAVEGMGPFGARLLDRFLPATAEQVREIVRQASTAAP